MIALCQTNIIQTLKKREGNPIKWGKIRTITVDAPQREYKKVKQSLGAAIII
jgi:hypothetical protein